MEDKPNYADNDGNEVNPFDLAKPQLCLNCMKVNDINELFYCDLIRITQQNNPVFVCNEFAKIQE